MDNLKKIPIPNMFLEKILKLIIFLWDFKHRFSYQDTQLLMLFRKGGHSQINGPVMGGGGPGGC